MIEIGIYAGAAVVGILVGLIASAILEDWRER